MAYEGILLIDKPKDFTSFDVVAKLKGILKMKKIGHAGTLDPMATGVLPVFLGSATKAIPYLENHDKKYEAEFKLGIETDTEDITGNVISECSYENIMFRDVENCAKLFLGDIEQIPPMYSAVKVDGKKLYELAREGKTVERKPRNITIRDIEVSDKNALNGEYYLSIYCSSGTYVRTLVSDIGRKLGTVATLTNLRRTMACGYEISDCHTLDDVERCGKLGEIDFILPLNSAFTHLYRFDVSKEIGTRFFHGQKIRKEQFSNDVLWKDISEVFTVYSEDKFIGLGECRENIVKAKKIFLKGEL